MKAPKNSAFLLACTLTLNALPAMAQDNSCVGRLHYRTELTAPSLESWAGGSAESECQLTEKLMGLFTSIQDYQAAQDKKNNPIPEQRAMRGTHAKGICVNGTYETTLDPSLTEKQKAVLHEADLFTTG